MPPEDLRYRPNTPAVIHESFGSESVVVHLESGLYYRLTHFAAELWPLVERGRSAREIVELLSRRHEAEPGAVEREAKRLLETFRDEALIVPRGELALEPEPEATSLDRKALGEIGFEKFTDMEEMLRLDPIHETGEQGWLGARS